MKDNSNEAERSRVICGAFNDLASVKGSVKEEQRLKLQKELTTLQQLQNIGICNLKDEDDLELMIGEMYFDNLATDVERQCPMITEIVKLLVTGKRRDERNMSLQVNINNMCKAAYYYITNVRRIRKYLSNQATQTLVHALIIGHIDYCNSILYGLPAKQIAKLQWLQNSTARLIFKIPRFYHISPILCTLHWLPVEFRIHFKIIIITFKATHGQAPVYLQEVINKREEKSCNLRSCAMGIMLQTPKTLTKKTLGDHAFLAAAPKLRNGLPSQIRNEPNFHRLKGLLKTHFCRLAFY